MSQHASLSDFKWNYLASLPDGTIRSRANDFIKAVNWSALAIFASQKREDLKCEILPPIGLGQNHMIRIIEFDDKVRWVARLRMPPVAKKGSGRDVSEMAVKSEISTIAAVVRHTRIPVPRVHAFESTGDCDVGAPFILMDCLNGNVGMDLGLDIPPQHKQEFFGALAKIHVQLSRVQLPKIGKIIGINKDGTYQQGPIPGLGGPFDTATEFYKAWSANVKFGMDEDKLREAAGDYAADILASLPSFRESVGKLADKISVRDHGPFPLCHGDFGHNNIIVDGNYHVLGVIDWEAAFAGPWEIVGDFPLSLTLMPASIDAPWNYNEDGGPVDQETEQKLADRKAYIAAVKREEKSIKEASHLPLSSTLQDTGRQELATAMMMFQDGKAGWYAKLIGEYSSQW